MKTFAELNAIRQHTYEQIALEGEFAGDTRIVVGMATCGIAAGATPVLNTLKEAVAKSGAKNVSVVQTGCIGMCRLEPIFEVTRKGEAKTTYVKMNPEKAQRVFEEHILGGKPVKEFTIGEA